MEKDIDSQNAINCLQAAIAVTREGKVPNVNLLLAIEPVLTAAMKPQTKYKKLYEMQRKRSQRAERALIEFCEKLANPAMSIQHLDFRERYHEASNKLTNLNRRINKFKTFHLFGRFWFGIEKKQDDE